ncbi:MAG: energy transducer TonB [Piscinibacter sp.]|uniref:energy transducer TonB n=2 Tax=Piscinibacter sp. TaxID=1903157 RepID=UPI0035B2FEB2
MSRPTSRDELAPAQRHAAVAAILALHAAAGWGLLQVDAVRSAVAEAAPLFVDLIAPPAPEAPAEPPPPPPQPITKTAPPPAPLIAAAPAPTPAPPAFVAPEPPPEPAPPAPPEPVVVAVAPPAPPASAAPAPPRELPASAIQYLDPPAPVYPRASRRNAEAGLVVVRVFVGVDGVPRQLQLLHSSGFARLDEAALEGVRQARFKPPTENGRAISGWARIPIPFELEK